MRAVRQSTPRGAVGVLLLAALVACSNDDSRRTTNDAAQATALTTVALAPPPPPPTAADFAGAETCQSCHASEYATWKRSTHGTAGGVPNGISGNATSNVRVIAPFNGTPIRFRDAS